MEKKNIVDSLVGIIQETEEQDKMLQSQNVGWRKELRERFDWTQNTTIKGKVELEKFIQQELDKAREEGKREVFSQEELKILMWLVRDRKQGIDWNYKTKRISEWDKLVSDGLFNKLEGLSKLKDNK